MHCLINEKDTTFTSNGCASVATLVAKFAFDFECLIVIDHLETNLLNIDDTNFTSSSSCCDSCEPNLTEPFVLKLIALDKSKFVQAKSFIDGYKQQPWPIAGAGVFRIGQTFK